MFPGLGSNFEVSLGQGGGNQLAVGQADFAVAAAKLAGIVAGFFGDAGGVLHQREAVAGETVAEAVVARLQAGGLNQLGQARGKVAGFREGREAVRRRVGIKPRAQVRQDGNQPAVLSLGNLRRADNPIGVDVVREQAQAFGGSNAGEQPDGQPREPPDVVVLTVPQEFGDFRGAVRVNGAGAGALELHAVKLIKGRRKPPLPLGMRHQLPDIGQVIVLRAQTTGQAIDPGLKIGGLQVIEATRERRGKNVQPLAKVAQIVRVQRAAPLERGLELHERDDCSGDSRGGSKRVTIAEGKGGIDQGKGAENLFGFAVFGKLGGGESLRRAETVGDAFGCGLSEGVSQGAIGELATLAFAIDGPRDGVGGIALEGGSVDGNANGTGAGDKAGTTNGHESDLSQNRRDR